MNEKKRSNESIISVFHHKESPQSRPGSKTDDDTNIPSLVISSSDDAFGAGHCPLSYGGGSGVGKHHA